MRADYQVRLDHWGGTAGSYDGLDRFGRVVDHRWFDYNGTMDVDRIKHGYDRSSNRLWRVNVIAFDEDELYEYDGLNRLIDMRRGVLNAGKDAIATLEFAQDWSLDPVGNWTVFRQDDDGDSTWNLDQSRTHSLANEIDTISNPWTDPQHDAAGNMTTVPQPADPTSGYTATYDAWKRLVKLEDGTDTVAEYAYDGRGRRIVKKTYDGGGLAETRHLYYTNDWQVIEERVGSSSDAERQFVWGARYVDDLILRDRDTTSGGDGTLDERRYALQDANFNVTTIIDNTGAVAERFRYTAYGEVTFLDANFAEQTTNESPAAWEVLYAGYRFDAESHLYHVRHRALHPVLGRWLQRDPLGYVDGMSLYEYGRGAPTGRLDGSGLSSNGATRWMIRWREPQDAPHHVPDDDGVAAEYDHDWSDAIATIRIRSTLELRATRSQAETGQVDARATTMVFGPVSVFNLWSYIEPVLRADRYYVRRIYKCDEEGKITREIPRPTILGHSPLVQLEARVSDSLQDGGRAVEGSLMAEVRYNLVSEITIDAGVTAVVRGVQAVVRRLSRDPDRLIGHFGYECVKVRREETESERQAKATAGGTLPIPQPFF